MSTMDCCLKVNEPFGYPELSYHWEGWFSFRESVEQMEEMENRTRRATRITTVKKKWKVENAERL